MNPAFLNFPEEAALIGAMVIGYGELELSFGALAGGAMQHKFAVLNALHCVRSETNRIEIADALCKTAIESLGFKAEYEVMLQALRYCLKIRNEYAHSHWAEMEGKLFVTDGEKALKNVGSRPLWFPVPLDMLKKQEAFFENTRMQILALDMNSELILNGKRAAIKTPPQFPLPAIYRSGKGRHVTDYIPPQQPQRDKAKR